MIYKSWLLSFHIIGIVLWIGGIIALARLCGAHTRMADATTNTELITYENKSYWFAIFPGFLLTLGTGLWMLLGDNVRQYLSVREGFWGPTFHMKLFFVVIIIILDQVIASKMRGLQKTGEGSRPFFMAAHGIIGLLFIIIVILMETRLLA